MLFALFVTILLYAFVPDMLMAHRLYTSPMGVLDICESCKKFFVTIGIKLPQRPVIKTPPDSPNEFSHSNSPDDTLPEKQSSTESASEADKIHFQNLHNTYK
jgi:hypothetical protein